MKKILLLVSAVLLTFGLSACGMFGDDTEVPDGITSLVISGLEDQTYEEDTTVDLLDGVSVMGDDDVNYLSELTIDSDDCTVDSDGTLTSMDPGTCTIDYTVVVEGIYVKETIVITFTKKEIIITDAPTLIEWTFDDETDLDGWSIYTANGGSIEMSVEDGAMKLVTTSGGARYETRLDYQGLPLEVGYPYKVSFKMKSDIDGKKVHLNFGELLPAAPYFTPFKAEDVDIITLTTDWVEYEYTFNMELNNQNGGPLFEMGNITDSEGLDATIWVDDLLIEGGSGTDTIDPVIEGAMDEVLFIGDQTTFDVLEGVTATDLNDGDLTSDIVVSGDTLDVTTAGTYVVTYTVSDAAGNEATVDRTFEVKADTEAPVISGADDETVIVGSGFTLLDGVTAIDNRDGDVTADIVIGGDAFDAAVEGTYVVTYTVEDELGNSASVERELTVLDVTFIPTDQIPNGDFETEAWQFFTAEWLGAAADFDVVDGKVVIDVENVTADTNWSIILEHAGLEFVNGTSYRVTFDALSSVPRDIEVELSNSGATNQIASLTTEMDTYVFDFTATADTTDGFLKLLLGFVNDAPLSTLTFDNVMVEQLDGTAVVADSDQIVNGDFSMPTLLSGWQTWSNAGDEDFRVYYNEAWFTYNAAGAESWHNKLEHPNVELEAGKYYRLTFKAKGDEERDFQVSFWDGSNGFESGALELGTEFQDYTFIFLYTGAATATLEYQLGQLTDNFAGTRFFLDNVVLEVQDGEANMPDPEWFSDGITAVDVDGTVTMTYTDTPDPWWNANAQYINLVFDETEDAVEFTFTGTAGHDYLFKVEGPGLAKEVTVTADGTEQTTLVSLSEFTPEQRATFNKLVFFVKTIGATGTATLSWDYAAAPVLPPAWNAYGIETAEVDDTVTLTYTDVPANWWEANAQYENLVFDGTNDAIEFTFTGTAGHDYLIKIENPGAVLFKEVTVTADGTEQTLLIPLNEYTEEQRNSFNKFIFFVKTSAVSGTTVLSWDYAVAPVVDPLWVDHGIAVNEVADTVTLTYTDVPANWWEANAQYEHMVFDGTNDAIEFTFTGTLDHEYLFKVESPNGVIAKEASIVADGTEQTLLIPLSEFTEAERSTLWKVIFFVKTPAATGTATVAWDYAVAPTAGTFSTTDYVDGPDGVYTIGVADGVVTVDYSKGATQGWSYFRVDFDAADVSGLNTLTMTVDGVSGKTMLIKPNDLGALEQTVTFGDDPVTVTFTAGSFTTIIVFAEGGVGDVSGQLTILETVLTYVEPTT